MSIKTLPLGEESHGRRPVGRPPSKWTDERVTGTSECKWRVGGHCGVLGRKLLFSSGRLQADDDDDVTKLILWLVIYFKAQRAVVMIGILMAL